MSEKLEVSDDGPGLTAEEVIALVLSQEESAGPPLGDLGMPREERAADYRDGQISGAKWAKEVIDDGTGMDTIVGFQHALALYDIARRKYCVKPHEPHESRVIPEVLGIYRLRSAYFFTGFFRAAREEYDKNSIKLEETEAGVFDHFDCPEYDDPPAPKPDLKLV